VKTLTILAVGIVSVTAAIAGAAPTEMKGAAILQHPCGKMAVKHMGLIHAGKMDDAAKLGSKEMQDQWKALPAKDREMMTQMMKETSEPEAQLSREIRANGVLSIDGKNATLTVKKEHKDQSGSSTETWTQKYVIDGANCAISR
jgi:hypothetical protein